MRQNALDLISISILVAIAVLIFNPIVKKQNEIIQLENQKKNLINEIKIEENLQRNVFNETWNIIFNEAYIPSIYKNEFENLYPFIINNAYGDENNALMNWILSRNKCFNIKMEKKLIMKIEKQRKKLQESNLKLKNINEKLEKINDQLQYYGHEEINDTITNNITTKPPKLLLPK